MPQLADFFIYPLTSGAKCANIGNALEVPKGKAFTEAERGIASTLEPDQSNFCVGKCA